MAKNPEKIAGNHGPCFKCGTEMFCNEVEYQGTKKLQWQEQDGKAHYSFDVATKATTCRQTAAKIKETVQSIIQQKIQLKDVDLNMDTLNKVLEVTQSSSQILKAIEYGVREQLGETAPAHIGLYVKIISEKMLQVPNLETILHGVKGKNV